MFNRTTIIYLLLAWCCYIPSVKATGYIYTIEWGYNPPSDEIVAGFRLYQEGTFVCESMEPTATSMNCSVSLVKATTNFTLATLFTDGSESPHSPPYSVTIDPETDPEPDPAKLSAMITANVSQGPAPLTVIFDSSSSTGQIATYTWNFGDNDTADISNTNHTFTLPGTYTTTLTITDSDNNISSDTIIIIVTDAPATNTAPTADIIPSATVGETPAVISFDGSGSNDVDGTVSSYEWNFGDGSSSTGKLANHTFTIAGTYGVRLMVTDNHGLTGTTTIPIIVSTPAEEVNQPPLAGISVFPTSGIAPLTVTFNGASSKDSDGSIESYTWNFSDGTSASGITVTHTFITEGTYTTTLQVQDNKGLTDTTNTNISVETTGEDQQLAIEVGEVYINSEWNRVELQKTFNDPIVVAGPPTHNNSAPGVILLRNISPTGFEIKFNEWDYLDDSHDAETVSYLVIEKGNHTVNGTTIDAGTFSGSTRFTDHSFNKPFTASPVVLTTIASNNGNDTIAGRIKDISDTGFAYYYREQERNKNKHVTETVNYIAWQQGSGTIDTITYTAATTEDAITHKWKEIAYQKIGDTHPFFLADMQTTDGKDTSSLRAQTTVATEGFNVKIEEEQSKNNEVKHTTEIVGYIIMDTSPMESQN